MSEEKEEIKQAEPEYELSDFLESHPPNQVVRISKLAKKSTDQITANQRMSFSLLKFNFIAPMNLVMGQGSFGLLVLRNPSFLTMITHLPT